MPRLIRAACLARCCFECARRARLAVAVARAGRCCGLVVPNLAVHRRLVGLVECARRSDCHEPSTTSGPAAAGTHRRHTACSLSLRPCPCRRCLPARETRHRPEEQHLPGAQSKPELVHSPAEPLGTNAPTTPLHDTHGVSGLPSSSVQPAGQGMHCRSLVYVPLLASNVPDSQLDSGMHTASDVNVGGWLWYIPVCMQLLLNSQSRARHEPRIA